MIPVVCVYCVGVTLQRHCQLLRTNFVLRPTFVSCYLATVFAVSVVMFS